MKKFIFVYIIIFAIITFVKVYADSDYQQIFLTSLKEGDLDKVLAIIESPSFDPNFRDERSFTPLHLSAYAGYENIVQILINKGAKINEKDEEGYTPLHWASFKGYLDIAVLLIKNGADVNNKNNLGSLPILEACQEGHKDIVILLVKNGADINVKLGQLTPMGLAEQMGHHEIVDFLNSIKENNL